MLIAGATCLALAALVIAVGTMWFGSRIEDRNLTRNVATSTEDLSEVPGELAFRVTPALSGDERTMSVGVGTSTNPPDLDCGIAVDDTGGSAVAVRRARSVEVFVDDERGLELLVVTDDLEPGSYIASCDWSGEPGDDGVTFGVGRVLTTSEAMSLVGPVLGLLGSLALGVVMALVGGGLVVAAVVRRRRAARRSSAGAADRRPPENLPPHQEQASQPQAHEPDRRAPHGRQPDERPPDQSDWRPPPGTR